MQRDRLHRLFPLTVYAFKSSDQTAFHAFSLSEEQSHAEAEEGWRELWATPGACDEPDVEAFVADARRGGAVLSVTLRSAQGGRSILRTLADCGEAEAGAILDELLAAARPQPFTYAILQDEFSLFVAHTTADLPAVVRARVESYFENGDPEDTGYQQDEMPAAIDRMTAETLADAVAVTVTAPDELTAFLSAAWMKETSRKDLRGHFAAWRTWFPAPEGNDLVAAHVEKVAAEEELRAAKFERERAEREVAKAAEVAKQPVTVRPEASPHVKAFGAVVASLAGLLDQESPDLLALAAGLRDGGRLVVLPPDSETDMDIDLPTLDDSADFDHVET